MIGNIADRRKRLGLTRAALARRLGVPLCVVQALEGVEGARDRKARFYGNVIWRMHWIEEEFAAGGQPAPNPPALRLVKS